MHSLLFFEFIGTSELLVVLVVALIIFGPRKLPELGRSLGQAMHQLRGATEDFKRTWETEARLDTARSAPLAAASDADLADAAASQEFAPGDTSLEASAFEENHAPQQEAPALNGLAFTGPEASFGEA
jgi:sec-independent protein translocase protein TatA